MLPNSFAQLGKGLLSLWNTRNQFHSPVVGAKGAPPLRPLDEIVAVDGNMTEVRSQISYG
jgi:hypothetical protein